MWATRHQDWVGTERMQTSYNGQVETDSYSLPFGDGYSHLGTDEDAYHFAGLDQDDTSSGAPFSEHAQFRNYSSTQGRWLSPDPYDGSYDATNPQSFNRYAYVMNNPLSFTDILGLDCNDNNGTDDGDDGTGGIVVGGGCNPCDQNPLQCYGGGSGGNGGTLCAWFGLCNIPTGQNNPGGTASAAPSKSLLHELVCSVPGFVGQVAQAFGKTFGIGIGGSAGAGLYSQGFAISLGVQIVADPHQNLAIAGTFGAVTPFSGIVVGAGAVGGAQVSLSNAQNVSQLSGPAVDGSVGGGGGYGAGVDVSAGLATNGQGQATGSSGVYTGTLTGPFAVGGLGGGGMVTHTGVLSTSCSDVW